MPSERESIAALVTGAGGAIGAAICRALAELGASLHLVGRRSGPLELAAAGIPSAVISAADLTTDAGLEAVVETTRVRFDGRLDVLVHCAGIYRSGPTGKADVNDLDCQFAANVRAPYRLTAALLPTLKRCRGQIMFVNSSQGIDARAGVGQFAATQHALRGLADSLRQEVNDHGVRVLTLHLGRTASARQERIFNAEGRPYRPELLIQPEDVAHLVAAFVTLPRTAEVTTVSVRPTVNPNPAASTAP